MKSYIKLFVLASLFFSFLFVANAQFTFGPKIGVNFSNFINESSMKTGVEVGIFLEMGKSLYFHPEVNYSYRTSKMTTDLTGIKKDTKLKNHYLDIPILIGYKFINKTNFKLRAFVGPRLGILFDNSIKGKRKDNPVSTLQIGQRTGIGVDIWRFIIDFSYDVSFNKFNETTWWTQNMLNLGVGFKIIKGKGREKK